MNILYDILKNFNSPSQLRIDVADPKIHYYGITGNASKSENEQGWFLFRRTKLSGVERIQMATSQGKNLPSWSGRAAAFSTLENNLEVLDEITIIASPLLKSSTFKKYVTVLLPNIDTQIAPANPNRIGFSCYNNSTNSMYAGIEPIVAGGLQIFQLATNAGPTAGINFFGPTIWTGPWYGRRNAGTGSVICYDFEA